MSWALSLSRSVHVIRRSTKTKKPKPNPHLPDVESGLVQLAILPILKNYEVALFWQVRAWTVRAYPAPRKSICLPQCRHSKTVWVGLRRYVSIRSFMQTRAEPFFLSWRDRTKLPKTRSVRREFKTAWPGINLAQPNRLLLISCTFEKTKGETNRHSD